MLRDMYTRTMPVVTIAAQTAAADVTGAVVDLQGYGAATMLLEIGAGGITFTGSTLTTSTTINTSAIRLILNGVDVSSSLTITPTSPATNVAVSFGLAGSTYTLASNTVYDASIILQDSLGRSTTNAWTFDTFTDAYLARYGNIEHHYNERKRSAERQIRHLPCF